MSEPHRSNDDPLIDACLDEILGQQSPPDLTEQILAALEKQRANQTVGPPVAGTASGAPVEIVAPIERARSLKAGRDWNQLLIALSLLVILSLSLFVMFRQDGNDVAETDTTNTPTPGQIIPTEKDGDESPERRAETDRPRRRPTPPVLPRETNRTTPGPQQTTPEPTLRDVPTQLADAKLPGDQIVAAIDQRLLQRWQAAGVTSSVAVDDREWCRRVYEQLIGREPNAREVARFASSSEPSKRAELVDALLSDSYATRFSHVWAKRLTDWLLPIDPVNDQRGIAWRTYRAGLRTHLARSLKAEQPYDELVHRLLTATGSNDSLREDFDMATNYMLALIDDDRAEVTSQVCRTMMGQRLRCAQCHDDTRAGTTQNEFWQLASVFNTVEVDRFRPGRGKLQDQDAFEAEARYQAADGQWKTATSSFLVAGRDAAAESLRKRFADQLIESQDFAKATMNRMWGELLVYGLSTPVDDLGKHNPVSHPELLEELSQQFAAHDFDLKQAIRWVVLSQAFDRSSVTNAGNVNDFPASTSVALFSRSYFRKSIYPSTSDGLQFLADGGRPKFTDPQVVDQGTLLAARRGQVLGEDNDAADVAPMGQLLPPEYVTSIKAMVRSKLTPEQQLNHLVMLVHARKANAAEKKLAAPIFAEAKERPRRALERIAWALLNSK